MTLNNKVLVEHLEVVKSRPTLAHATISKAEELSRNYRHVRSVNSCTGHHIRAIATYYELTFLNVRSYKYLESINRTSKVRTIYLTSRCRLPTFNKSKNGKNIRCSKYEIRSKLACCIINSLLSNLKYFYEAFVVLRLGLNMLQIIHLITSFQITNHLLDKVPILIHKHKVVLHLYESTSYL